MNKMKECMLEDLLIVERMHEGHRETNKRDTYMSTIKQDQDHRIPRTLCHAEVKTCYTERTPITQQHNYLTQTPQSTSSSQRCHVELCHELSRTHHYYGPYLL